MAKYLVKIKETCAYHSDEWKILEIEEPPTIGTKRFFECDRDIGWYNTYPSCENCDHLPKVKIISIEAFSEERAKELHPIKHVHSRLDTLLIF